MSITIDVDLRDQLGAARDQGTRPTCLVFAVSGAHEAKQKSSEYLSPEFLFFSGAQRSHKDPGRGLTRTAVREALVEDGQPTESAWPYLSKAPSTKDWKPPPGIAVHAAHKATIDFSDRTVGEVVDVLRTGTPVLLVVALTVAMYTPDAEAIVRARASDAITTRRHALVAVGAGHADDGSYLLVRNSWGQSWGKAGHGWIHEPYLTPQLQTTAVIT